VSSPLLLCRSIAPYLCIDASICNSVSMPTSYRLRIRLSQRISFNRVNNSLSLSSNSNPVHRLSQQISQWTCDNRILGNKFSEISTQSQEALNLFYRFRLGEFPYHLRFTRKGSEGLTQPFSITWPRNSTRCCKN
jgi:hypothetical protein